MNKKLFLWLSGDILHYCLGYFLQKDHGYKISAVIDIPNRPKKFFQKQKLVEFDNLWYFHDHIKKLDDNPDIEYLENFEKKYGINLHQLAINERMFYRFNDFNKFI